MKLTDVIRTRMYLRVPARRVTGERAKYGSSGKPKTDWCRIQGERFYRAFDTVFGLQPITEFPYLLKYFDRGA